MAVPCTLRKISLACVCSSETAGVRKQGSWDG